MNDSDGLYRIGRLERQMDTLMNDFVPLLNRIDERTKDTEQTVTSINNELAAGRQAAETRKESEKKERRADRRVLWGVMATLTVGLIGMAVVLFGSGAHP